MKTTALFMLRTAGVLLTAGATLGCGLGPDESPELGVTIGAIENGTPHDIRDASIANAVLFTRPDGSALGSGALIRNDWVLTAMHLFPLDRLKSPATTMRIVYGDQVLTASEIVLHPTLDVALVRLSTPASIAGSTVGFVRPLSTRSPTELAGQTADCWGFGANDASGNGAGVLRQATMPIWGRSGDFVVLSRNTLGQLLTSGDSGAVCIHNGQALGVHSYRSTVPGSAELKDFMVSASVFATWATESVINRRVTASLTAAAGSWGTWYGPAYCPPGQYAIAYRMRVEPSQGSGDDTSLNSVQLQCAALDGTKSAWVSAHDGFWGSWTGAAPCANGSSQAPRNFLNGARLRVEAPQGSGDDTGANDATFICTDGTTVNPGGGRTFGTWSEYATCPMGSAVCGVSVRVEAPQGSNDDTAMNGLRFECCQVAPPAPYCTTPINERWQTALGSPGSTWVASWGDPVIDTANRRLRISHDDVAQRSALMSGSYVVSHSVTLSGGTVFTPYPTIVDALFLPSLRRAGNDMQLGGAYYGGSWSATTPAGFAGVTLPAALTARVTTYVKVGARQVAVKVEAGGKVYRSPWSTASSNTQNNLAQFRLVGENIGSIYAGSNDHVYVGPLGGCEGLSDTAVDDFYAR